MTSRPSSRLRRPRSRARSGSRRCARARSARRAAPATRASRSAMTVRGAARRRPTSIVPGTRRRAGQLDHQLRRDDLGLEQPAPAARPFSKRAARLAAQAQSFCDVRWMFGPFQVATSSSTRVVSGRRPRERARPSRRRSTSGRRRRRSRSMSRVERALCAVERRRPVSPSRARAHDELAAATRSRSNACSGWPVSSIT